MSRSTKETDWSDKQVFTTGEAAEVCKVSQQTIIRCFDSGRLKGFRVPGSRFRRIPRAELIRFMRENTIPTDTIESSSRRLLVVDDDPEIIALFKEAVEEDGRFDARYAQTGYDAGMLTEAFRPAVLLLDYMLPDLNGDIVCRRLRENDAHNSTHVVFISGAVSQDEVHRLLDAGASEFIRKPFDIQAVLDRVAELIAA